MQEFDLGRMIRQKGFRRNAAFAVRLVVLQSRISSPFVGLCFLLFCGASSL
jgi:hypothetical protein